MDTDLPPLTDVLGRLPWFSDLTRQHRAAMLAEVSDRLVVEVSREEFTAILARWSDVAHVVSEAASSARLRASGSIVSVNPP